MTNNWIKISDKPPTAPCVLGYWHPENDEWRTVAYASASELECVAICNMTHWHPLDPPPAKPEPEHPATAAFANLVIREPIVGMKASDFFKHGYKAGLLKSLDIVRSPAVLPMTTIRDLANTVPL